MKRFVASSVVLVVFGLSACIQTSVPPSGGEQSQAPNYSEASSWKYRVVHRTYSGVWKSNLLNGEVEIVVRNGEPKVFHANSGKAVEVFPDPNPLAVLLPTEAVAREQPQYFNFPLWVGKDWHGSEFWYHKWRGTRSWVTGMENVVTPAGAFSAYRIEREIRIFIGVRNFYRTEVYFYSPQTRSIIKYDSSEEMKDLVGDQRFGVQETFAIELLDFKN
jgi:hypothetical protein